MLVCVAVCCCNVLQCVVAVCCSEFYVYSVPMSEPCIMMQCAALCCGVLQCVADCYIGGHTFVPSTSFCDVYCFAA